MDGEGFERGLTGEGKVLKVGLPGQGFHEGKVQLGGLSWSMNVPHSQGLGHIGEWVRWPRLAHWPSWSTECCE